MKPTMTRRLAAGYLIVAILASLVLQGLAARRDLQEIPGVRTYKVTVGGVLPYHIRPWHRGVQWDWTPPKLYPQYVLPKWRSCDCSGSRLQPSLNRRNPPSLPPPPPHTHFFLPYNVPLGEPSHSRLAPLLSPKATLTPAISPAQNSSPFPPPPSSAVFRWVSPITHDVRLFESEAKYKACDFSGSKLIFPYSPVGWMLYWIKPDMVGTSIYFGSSFIGDCKAGLKVKFTVYPYGKSKKGLDRKNANMTSNSTPTAGGGGA
ncbi:unnamed protein product [Closterium sp. NIES-65]|nr:unnamed protein product [Closterium sp. NIES-65]